MSSPMPLPSTRHRTPEERQKCLLLAREKISKYCALNHLNSTIVATVDTLFQRAFAARHKGIGSLRSFLAACIFIACRQAQTYEKLWDITATIDAGVEKTLEALWYLDVFIDGKEGELREVKIKVVDEPSGRLLGAVTGSRTPAMEEKLCWVEEGGKGEQKIVVDKLYDTTCPQLWKVCQRPRETLAIIGKNEGEEDWDVIDWKAEQCGDTCAKQVSKKAVEKRGWMGAIRRGIFG